MKASRRGVGKISKAVVAAAAIVVVLIGLSAVTFFGSKPSTTTSPTTSSSRQTSSVTSVTVSTIQSSTLSSTAASSTSKPRVPEASTNSSAPLAIAIWQAISDPPEARASSSIFIYNLTLKNNGQTPYPINESYFTLTSASNTVYNPMNALAIQQKLFSLNLTAGRTAVGQVAFQIPTSETPAKLEYHIPISIDESITNLPMPSSLVSEPDYAITTHVQGTSNGAGGQILAAYAAILNTSNAGFFYTGQTIYIAVSLLNGYTGTNVTVNTIVSGTPGLSVLQLQPSLPVHVLGSDDQSTEIVLYLAMITPETSFTGPITLDVTATGSV